MMKARMSGLLIPVLLACLFSLSTPAWADLELMPPFLYFGGNYQYDIDSKMLAFSYNFAESVEYLDGRISPYDGTIPPDPVLGASIVFGPLSNDGSDPQVFGPSTIEVTGFFRAELLGLVAEDDSEMWGYVHNIIRYDTTDSLFMSEFITQTGDGHLGKIYMNFTPAGGTGGVETFTADSSGALAGIVAAPVPPSAILLFSGLASLAFSRRIRVERNSR